VVRREFEWRWSQDLEDKKDAVSSAPKRAFIATETVERAVVDIGEALEAARDFCVGFPLRWSGIMRSN
jgi:hypothetical protein